MILLREFKEHKRFLIYNFLHQLLTPTHNLLVPRKNINLDKMRLFLLWYVVVERELSGQKR